MARSRTLLGLTASALLASLAALAAAPGCRPIGLRPKEPAAWELTGEGAGCHVVSDFGEPLVVDWQAHQRANVEEAMHDGVAVVAYDCKSLRLLKGCRLDGSYGFMAVSKKEQTVRFESAEEVAVNLPGFGVPLVKELKGELRQDSTLDLAMILVGKRRTTVIEATRDKLIGGKACEGATHFVRGAFVGAFAMGTGARGGASLGVGLFSGSAQSSKLARYRDGEPETCSQVTPGSAAPPATCDALLRLELVAIGSKPAPSEADEVKSSCPAGMVMAADKCARPEAKTPHQCDRKQPQDCAAQCERGHLGSCVTLGILTRKGEGVPQDKPRAIALYQKTCDKGSARACANLGLMYATGEGTTKDMIRAAKLFEQACDVGDSTACTNLGVQYDKGWGLSQDKARAALFYTQGCHGGEAHGCYNLGVLHDKGEGMPADRAKAAALYKRACDGDDLDGCGNLASLLESGEGVPKDLARAVSLYQRGCDENNGFSCAGLGSMFERGVGVARDPGKAAELYKKACALAEAFGCEGVKRLGQGK